MPINWEEKLKPLQELIMQPIIFNDLTITMLDVVPALHDTDWFIPAHRHPWFEFNYVSEGSVYTILNGSEFLITAGQIYIIPPGTPHGHRHCNHEGDNGFCLRWQLKGTEKPDTGPNSNGSAKDIIKILSAQRPYALELNACQLVENVSKVKALVSKQSVFTQWLLSLFDFWSEESNESSFQNDHEKILIQQAILYLSEYYASSISVKEVANTLNISYRHLARVFKHITGVTIIEKLTDIRINEAKKRLKETDKSIHEIAREVGFDNEYYFTNIFSQHSYITPSKFRRKFKT